MKQHDKSSSHNRQQGGDDQKNKQQQQQQQASGPDSPSKHTMKQPVNQEPHRESGQGRHEPSP